MVSLSADNLMSYFSMIFSQCAPGRLYSAATWHAEYFSPLHIRASKTSSTASGTKTINKHSTFSFFFLCYLIKKRQSHDVWLSNSRHFRNYFSSHGLLMTMSSPHLQPLCLTPREWPRSRCRECNWEIMLSAVTGLPFIRLQATW